MVTKEKSAVWFAVSIVLCSLLLAPLLAPYAGASPAGGFQDQGQGSLIYGASYFTTTSGVNFTVWVYNGGEKTATVYTGFPEAQVVITPLGSSHEIWSSSYGKIYPYIIFPLQIQPLENLTWKFTWDYVDNGGLPVAPGEYVATAYALGKKAAVFELDVGPSGLTGSSGSGSYSGQGSSGNFYVGVNPGGPMINVSATNTATTLTITVNSAKAHCLEVKIDVKHFGREAASLSEVIDQMGLGNSLFSLNAGPYAIVSWRAQTREGEVHQFVLLNATSAVFYSFQNANGKLVENPISLGFNAALGEVQSLGLSGGEANSAATELLQAEQGALSELRSAEASGNLSSFLSGLAKVTRVNVRERSGIVLRLSTQNAQVPPKAFVKGLLTGALALEKNVEYQISLSQEMGIQVPQTVTQNLTIGEGYLQQALTAYASGEENAALHYVHLADRAFIEALRASGQARAGVAAVSNAAAANAAQTGELTQLQAQIQVAWRLENATSSLVPANSAASAYIYGPTGAKAELNMAQNALNAREASVCRAHLNQAMADLKSALLYMENG